MSETKLGSNATFTGTGKGLTVVGKHAYATNYDSAVATLPTVFEALNFQTGKHYIVGTFSCGIDNKPGSEHEFRIKFNNIVVFESKSDNGKETSLVNPFSSPIKILLPPNTEVKVEADVNAVTPVAIFFVGELYNG
jgi:hypothetical protein